MSGPTMTTNSSSDPENFSVAGKVIWITGASRGIGAAVTNQLARSGARLILQARNRSGLEAARQTAQSFGAEVSIMAWHEGVGWVLTNKGTPITIQKDTTGDNAGHIFQTPTSGQLLVAWQGATLSDGGTAVRLYRSTNGGTSFAKVGDIGEGTPDGMNTDRETSAPSRYQSAATASMDSGPNR